MGCIYISGYYSGTFTVMGVYSLLSGIDGVGWSIHTHGVQEAGASLPPLLCHTE